MCIRDSNTLLVCRCLPPVWHQLFKLRPGVRLAPGCCLSVSYTHLTVQDLLLHLPLRYEDRTHLYPIGELLPGVYATVEGEVLNLSLIHI